MMNENNIVMNPGGCYNDIKENTIALLRLVTKFVKIYLIKQKSLLGYIHSIDPQTYSIILLVPNESGTFQTTLIPGHAVLDVIEAVPTGNVIPPSKECRSTTIRNVPDRKERLITWFKLNYLPVSESGENIIFGNVIILPPYNTDDICTDNPIVAMQVTKIMNEMPDNFEPHKNSEQSEQSECE